MTQARGRLIATGRTAEVLDEKVEGQRPSLDRLIASELSGADVDRGARI